jgi:TIR domain
MSRPEEAPLQAYTGGEPSVFVSYARKDSNLVYPEIKWLQRAGYRVWYDRADILLGRDWFKEIDEAIGACACFVVFMTAAAVDSKYVRHEIEQALVMEKPFVCIYWEKLERPPHLEPLIGKIQALERYLFHKSEYEEQLRKALSEYVGRPEPPPEEEPHSPVGIQAPGPPPGLSWKAVCFILLLTALVFFFLALMSVAAPLFAATVPGDPLSNRLVGFLGGSVFLLIAAGLCAAAFVVNRKYLAGTKG